MRKLILLSMTALLSSLAWGQSYPTVVYPTSGGGWSFSGTGCNGSFNNSYSGYEPTPSGATSTVAASIPSTDDQPYGFAEDNLSGSNLNCVLNGKLTFASSGDYRVEVQYYAEESGSTASWPVVTFEIGSTIEYVDLYPTGTSHTSTQYLELDSGIEQYASYLVSIPSAGTYNVYFSSTPYGGGNGGITGVGQIVFYPDASGDTVEVMEQALGYKSASNKTATYSDLILAASTWLTSTFDRVDLADDLLSALGDCTDGQCERLSIAY